MKKISFIGTGIMGKSMIRNLMKNGYELSIYSRTKSKAADLIEEGALWFDTVKACVADAQAVITMVGYPRDVEDIYLGNDGILNNARSGSCVIDMTTSSPKLAERIYDAAALSGIEALDAPVSGGDTGAKNATLTIMVGGDRAAYNSCYPLFQAMGTTTTYEGKAGFGQHTKMANQIAIAGAISGTCEAIAYAKSVGLDVQTMLDSIGSGSAGSWQMANMAPRILNGNFAPGFYLKHFIKDLTIASQEAADAGLKLVMANDVLKMYQKLADENLGDLGTQALIKYYEK